MWQFILDLGLFLIYLTGFLILLGWTWRFWMLYVNTEWKSNMNWILLEIKLPREINKSPEATELFLRSIIQTGGLGLWWKQYWQGRVPTVFSLEIACLEGVIHFYIRTEKKFQTVIESAIYSQYPNVEITVAEDYTNLINYDHEKDGEGVGLWGSEWELAKKIKEKEVLPNKDKNKLENIEYAGDMYPIKTYKDWGLDKDPKEMYKHDPLTYFLESLAAIGKGEYYWHQIIVRAAATNKDNWDKVYEIKGSEYAGKEKTLDDLIKVEKIRLLTKFSAKKKGEKVAREDDASWKTEIVETGEVKDGKAVTKKQTKLFKEDLVVSEGIKPIELTEEKKKQIELINRKMAKPRVFAKLRTIYLAEPGKFNPGMISVHMAPIIAPFNEADFFNTFKPNAVAEPYDFPWQNVLKRRDPWRKQELNDDYKNRGGFFSHYSSLSESVELFFDLYLWKFTSETRGILGIIVGIIFHPFSNITGTDFVKKANCLNLEELATLYHFPGEVAALPNIPRIDSVKGAPPANLPK